MVQDLNARGITIAVVTHDRDVAQHARRILQLRDGRLGRDEPVPQPLVARPALA